MDSTSVPWQRSCQCSPLVSSAVRLRRGLGGPRALLHMQCERRALGRARQTLPGFEARRRTRPPSLGCCTTLRAAPARCRSLLELWVRESRHRVLTPLQGDASPIEADPWPPPTKGFREPGQKSSVACVSVLQCVRGFPSRAGRVPSQSGTSANVRPASLRSQAVGNG